VVRDVAAQLGDASHPNSRHIVGVMVESNLVEGNQKLECGAGRKEKLRYGQSVTDACISWDDTERVLQLLAEGVQARRKVFGRGTIGEAKAE
jgi:3-deoxy-7-phosphoheptulonate synthase